MVGPNAASLSAIEGNYNAVPSQPVLPLAGLEHFFGASQIHYAQGAPYVSELPLPVPRTSLHPAEGDARFGLKGEYFDNVEFQGSPAMTRVDQQVEFDWNAASPSEHISAGHFGVRWSGTIQVPVAGDYSFSFTLAQCYPCGDAEGVKVYFDDKPLSDQPVPAS